MIKRQDNGVVLGGFTTVAWDKTNTFRTDAEAFLFSNAADPKTLVKFPIKDGGANAMYSLGSYCAIFGQEITIYGGGEAGKACCSAPSSYRADRGGKYSGASDLSRGRDGEVFKMVEYEVFSV